LDNNQENFQWHRFTTIENIAKSFRGVLFDSHCTLHSWVLCRRRERRLQTTYKPNSLNTKYEKWNITSDATNVLKFEVLEVMETVEGFSKPPNFRDIFPLTKYKIIAKVNGVYYLITKNIWQWQTKMMTVILLNTPFADWAKLVLLWVRIIKV